MREHINETLLNTKNEYINPQQLKRYFRHNIEQTSGGKTKIQFLRENTNWNIGERPKYMKELKRMEASTIFKARTRMLDVQNNFRGKYKDNTCRKCTETIESHEKNEQGTDKGRTEERERAQTKKNGATPEQK